MTEQRDALSREIDEELRREQLLRLWERYGIHVIALVVLVIAGIGGYKYLEYRRVVAAQAAGARFTAAAREAVPDKAEAQKALQSLAADGPGSYALLARLRLAAAERQAGQTDKAVAAYEDIAKQRGLDQLLADYAQLQAATMRLDNASFTEMQNRLNDLAADASPWRFSARELLGLAAQKAGRIEEARTQYQRLLSDRETPPSIGERARVMLAMITESELAKGQGTAPSPPGAAGDDKAKAKATDGKSK
jgi:hypothetical protein